MDRKSTEYNMQLDSICIELVYKKWIKPYNVVHTMFLRAFEALMGS